MAGHCEQQTSTARTKRANSAGPGKEVAAADPIAIDRGQSCPGQEGAAQQAQESAHVAQPSRVLGYLPWSAPAVPCQTTHIGTCSSHREGAVGGGIVRCITAQPKQGGPFQQLLPIQCYRVLRALRLRGLGLGYVPFVGCSRVGSQAVRPSRVCAPAGPAVHCKGISDPRQCHDVRVLVLCHAMACSVERESSQRPPHSTAACQCHCHCRCRCRRAGAHVAGAGASAPASVSMGLPRAEDTSHRTVQQNRSVGNSGGSAR